MDNQANWVSTAESGALSSVLNHRLQCCLRLESVLAANPQPVTISCTSEAPDRFKGASVIKASDGRQWPKGETKMEAETGAVEAADLKALVAEIVTSYVSSNQIPPADLTAVITAVYEALRSLGSPTEPEPTLS